MRINWFVECVIFQLSKYFSAWLATCLGSRSRVTEKRREHAGMSASLLWACGNNIEHNCSKPTNTQGKGKCSESEK